MWSKCFGCGVENLDFIPRYITWNEPNKAGGWHWSTDYELDNETEDFDIDEEYFCQSCCEDKVNDHNRV